MKPLHRRLRSLAFLLRLSMGPLESLDMRISPRISRFCNIKELIIGFRQLHLLIIWGSAPNPEVYRFGFPEGRKKAVFQLPSVTLPNALVAPQRCHILSIEKVFNSIISLVFCLPSKLPLKVAPQSYSPSKISEMQKVKRRKVKKSPVRNRRK